MAESTTKLPMNIKRCRDAADYANARSVTDAYMVWLDIDLGFQDVEKELEIFESMYGDPEGFYLLAFMGDQLAGGVGLRQLDDEDGLRIAEMKRLYVFDQFKGLHIGKKLCQALISDARKMGFAKIRLDTLPVMAAAHHLYTALGFYEIDAYRYNPFPGATYLECHLLDQD